MARAVLRVLVTGANGFIGKNLGVRLGESPAFDVTPFVRGDDAALLPSLIGGVDAVVHLAGENRPKDESAFATVNVGLTDQVCDAIKQEWNAKGRKVSLILASSAQAECDNPYGRSKRAAEDAVRALAEETGISATIFRLPGVFGKWCRPNYNSVVATFCHNIARGQPIRVDNPAVELPLVYVDDVVDTIISTLQAPAAGGSFAAVLPEYRITLGDLADQIRAFEAGRDTLCTERVGVGLTRALYATYVSTLPAERFVYDIATHGDARGVFVEMLKTADSGQFSFFTAHPGITRGGHYHHTKTEKFLVIRGDALFRYRHLLTDERIELKTSGARPQIVETIPGWSHDITNIGGEEMIVMLWANEVFDRSRPDTVASGI